MTLASIPHAVFVHQRQFNFNETDFLFYTKFQPKISFLER